MPGGDVAFDDEKDIISSLPYTEVISEETFCTDIVLMDGSRLLLPEVSER